MKAPSITVDGKKVIAMSPKTSAWRMLLKMQNSTEINLETEEGFEVMLSFMVAAFGNEAVNERVIENNVDLEDFFPLFKDLSLWLEHRINEKMKKLTPGNG